MFISASLRCSFCVAYIERSGGAFFRLDAFLVSWLLHLVAASMAGPNLAGGGDAGEGDRDIPVPAGQRRVRELLQNPLVQETAGWQKRQRRGT